MPAPALQVHGVTVPRLGFGTWRLRGEECRAAVALALELGYRHLDTAEMYENEEAVGEGLADGRVPREDVFVTTKVWRDHLRARDVRRAVEHSLRRLRTDYVDLLLVHWPNDEVELEETLDAFQEARAKGQARLIGVSNFTPDLLERALALVPDLANDQVEYHPYLNQDPLLELVRERGLFLTAYQPLARNRVAQEAVVQAAAATRGASAAQVALAWLLRQEAVAAIPKASSRAHMEDNLGALELALTDDEAEAIAGLARDERFVDPPFAPWK